MTPNDIFETLGNGALGILPWVAGGIVGAISYFFAVLGVRKGLAWFFSIVRERSDAKFSAALLADGQYWAEQGGFGSEKLFAVDYRDHMLEIGTSLDYDQAHAASLAYAERQYWKMHPYD